MGERRSREERARQPPAYLDRGRNTPLWLVHRAQRLAGRELPLPPSRPSNPDSQPAPPPRLSTPPPRAGLRLPALDGFETEPLPPPSPRWKLDNAILTPHVSNSSPRVGERSLALLVENVRRFNAGEPLLNLVDRTVGY